jgi:hypothetical protein
MYVGLEYRKIGKYCIIEHRCVVMVMSNTGFVFIQWVDAKLGLWVIPVHIAACPLKARII